MVVLEERLGEEDDHQEKLNKVPYIVLERGRRRRRGHRCD
jgi:hypothetical protein